MVNGNRYKIFVRLSYCSIVIIALIFPLKAEAAKVLPRYQNKTTAVKSSSTALTVSVKLPYDKKAVNINLKNTAYLDSLSYSLNYFTNGKEEGVVGLATSIPGNTFYKELLFGTCSKGVCTYHTNLANIKLTLTFSFKSGKHVTKKYRIKV